jgi:hypothetical protein
MKGRLKKENQKWYVEEPSGLDFTGMPCLGGLYLIDPKYLKYYFLDDEDSGRDVEFEIVYNFHYGTNNEGVYSKIDNEYAKLIKPGETNTELKEEKTYTEEQVITAIKLAKMSYSSEAILQLLKTI